MPKAKKTVRKAVSRAVKDISCYIAALGSELKTVKLPAKQASVSLALALAGIAQNCPNPPAFILDGRIGGNQLEVHAYVNSRTWLDSIPTFSAPDPCGGRYIAYVSMIIGGLLADFAKKWAKSEPYYPTLIMDCDTFSIIRGPITEL